jgi:hypothetical protein
MELTLSIRKAASRVAADELFELIRGRVEGMGGARAWRESRRRQVNFYEGLGEGHGEQASKGEGGSE